MIFAHKLTIYSIIVDKGVICFVSKCGWDKTLPLPLGFFAENYLLSPTHAIEFLPRMNADNADQICSCLFVLYREFRGC
jgi:hypothetical protein